MLFHQLIESGLSFLGAGLVYLFGRFTRETKDRNIFLDLFSSVVLGVVFGFLSFLVVPVPIFRNVLMPGMSLLLTPLLVGGTMFAWGRYRRGKGLPVSALATFWGGALFAFASALVRFKFLQLF